MSSRFEMDEVELDLTPMIDIVFNLLIFFMCATKFRTPEGVIEAFLPKDKGQAAGTPQIDLNEVRIKLLWYDESGRPTKEDRGCVVLKVGDDKFNNAGDFERGRFPEMSDVWKNLHAKLLEFKAGYKGSSAKGLPVIIDARRQVPTKYVISALNEVVRAGISDVTFAAPEIDY
ncbi:MAG: ExbD/TolR family protein [Planctomycetota bacterium]